jgi:hypothetical protein
MYVHENVAYMYIRYGCSSDSSLRSWVPSELTKLFIRSLKGLLEK